MSTKDIVQDIVKHTAGLGFIQAVKVTGNSGKTELNAMDPDRTVILKAKLHGDYPEFSGEFGLGNMGLLQGITKLTNYNADGATVEVVSRERNGENAPDHLLFKDKDCNKDQYRFMSKEIIEQALQAVKFKGVEWDVTVEPTKQKVAELNEVAAIYGAIEPNMRIKNQDGNLNLSVGASDGSFTGNRTFANNVDGEINHEMAWPLAQVLAILKLGMSGACVMSISTKGALQISVDSGLAKYDYILPAQTA